ncbi:MAG: hypothetical protein ACKN9V_07110 [Pseudomonadota bacterium]
MNKFIYLATLFFMTNLSFSIQNESDKPFSLPPESLGNQRLMCSAFTGAKLARFDQCRGGSEVMVGIRSLDPLTVYCANLIVNCSRDQEHPERD